MPIARIPIDFSRCGPYHRHHHPLDHGGDVVQTFNTVDIYSNDAYSTSHATKTAATACEHLLQAWQQFGGPTGPSLITKARSAAATIPQVLEADVRA